MSVTNVVPCYDVAARVAYVTRGDRGVLVSNPHASLSDFVADALQRSTVKGRKVQAISIIQSFDPSEFCVDSPEDLRACHFAGTELARAAWSGCDALVVTHADGEGACAHNHILVINDTSEGRAVPSAQRYHRTVARVNDEVMDALSLAVVGASPDGWVHQRERFPEGSFDRELGDAIAATIAEGDFYSAESYREALAKRGVTLEMMPLRERGPDGKRRDVLDRDGKPVVAGWRYSMHYSGDEGTRRKAARRRKASSLSPEFTREGVQDAIETRLVQARQRLRGEEAKEAGTDTTSIREEPMMTTKTKTLIPKSDNDGVDKNTDLKVRGLSRKRKRDDSPQEELTYEVMDIELQPDVLVSDLLALHDQGLTEGQLSETALWMRGARFHQQANEIVDWNTRKYSSSQFRYVVDSAQHSYDQQAEQLRVQLSNDAQLRQRIVSSGRTPTEWALARAAGSRGDHLANILLLLALTRLVLALRAHTAMRTSADLNQAINAMWRPDYRATAAKSALKMHRRGVKDIPDYDRIYRKVESQRIDAESRRIEGRGYDHNLDSPSL